jgi:hypothetical protein
MSLPGPKVLDALDDALRDIRREEGEILHKLSRSAERTAKVRETEGELLREFAAGRLPPEQELELSGRLVSAQNRARQTLDERAAEMAAATERLQTLDREFSELLTGRSERLHDIDRQQAALRGLSARIAAAISRDRDYEAAQQNLARLKEVAEAARAKARQADIDREQKGRPYRSDPLFTYLLDRGYGTPAYKAGGLVAGLDGWVAKLTGFDTARQHFAMLNAWPAQLRRHAEQQAEQVAAGERAIGEIEQGAIDNAGGATVRLALTDAQAKIEAIDVRLLAIQDERDTITAQQTGLVEVGDAAFDKAIAALVNALGSPDLQSLIGMARRRSPDTDAPLLAQLDDARLRVAEERNDTLDERSRLKTLAARRRSIEDIEYEFKVQKFDDPRSTFREDDIVDGALTGLLTGAMEPKDYWETLRQAQTWTVDASDLSGSIGLPHHGRQTAVASDSDDGFRRPRTPSESADA